MPERTKKPKKKILKSGMVTIIGRPNVGKSTLLNTLLGQKVAIVTQVPQTTRHQIRGILNEERGQIAFVDTPGLHLGRDRLDKYMNQSSMGTLEIADCVIYLVDTSRRIGKEEDNVAKHIKDIKAPIILALNKVDLGGKYFDEYIKFWEKVMGKSVHELENFTLIALSGKESKNIEELTGIIFDYLPEGDPLYPKDMVSDMPQKLAIAEIIREKLWELVREEIPHSLSVVVEDFRRVKGKTIHIKGLILIERDSQKSIVIGKNGQLLKTAGTKARYDLERLLGSRVFLDLYVKIDPKWRNDPATLQDLGYAHFD